MIARMKHSVMPSLRRRLQGEEGLTLSEMLATLVVMTLVSILLANGVPAAQRAYHKIVNASNADLLLSTTTSELRAILAEADTQEDIVCDSDANLGDSITFSSEKTGRQVCVYTMNDGVEGVFVRESVVNPVSGEETPVDGPRTLLPEAMAVGAGDVEFGTRLEDFGYNETTGLITVETIEIYGMNDNHVYTSIPSDASQRALTIRPITAP